MTPRRRRLPPMLPRYLVQGGFLLFFLWIGHRFSLWVATIAQGKLPSFERPPAVDGFLPISGLMGLRYWVESGELFPVHPAAPLILLAALLTGLLLKRGFCSWVCPVFPLSEGLWRLGQRFTGRTFAPPFWLDLPLRALKYLVLGFFLWQILWLMPLPGLRSFLSLPYHHVADVRLLHFFQSPSLTFLGFLGVMVPLCLFVQMAWCRYLCPYGALLGLVSLLSLSRIHRSAPLCVRCGLCSARCPAWLPVMHKNSIRSPECYACYRCVHGCPVPGAVEMKVPGRWILPSLVFGLVLLALFLGADLYGRATGRWHGITSPAQVFQYLHQG